jgi:hypothetical protein
MIWLRMTQKYYFYCENTIIKIGIQSFLKVVHRMWLNNWKRIFYEKDQCSSLHLAFSSTSLNRIAGLASD